jgi:hypothetical protein
MPVACFEFIWKGKKFAVIFYLLEIKKEIVLNKWQYWVNIYSQMTFIVIMGFIFDNVLWNIFL